MPATKTVSTCTPVKEEGTHVFSILGYSKHRGAGNGKCVTSGVFSVGGHDWVIRFYPDGTNMYYGHNLRSSDYIAMYLELLSNATVHASCDLKLVDQLTGLSTSVSRTAARLFNNKDNTRFAPLHGNFKPRTEFEASVYLRNDNLAIECVVTVLKEARVSETKPWPGKIKAPPPDIAAHLGRLLETKEAADVTFVVGEETFAAHRLVLAMRSPVFRAEFFGPMSWETAAAQQPSIPIGDMHPDVFRSLLHFIYNDSLPAMDDLENDDDDHNEMIRHLLAAADRYAMDRLKVVCQSILCESIDVQNVVTTLALADQHHCPMLKNACIEFISSATMDDVVATQGFADLRTSCPSVLVDALVRLNFLRRS